MRKPDVNSMKKTIGEESRPPAGDRETRQQILKAARELFLARGYKGVSMKEVAEEVQVTSAALYYHFPGGKQDLFFSIIQMMLEEWTQGALLATASSQGLRERLNRLTQYLLTLPIDRFSILLRDIHENVLDHDTKRMDLLQIRDTFVQHVTDLFQQAIDAGEITQDIPAALLASMYEGMSISVLRDKHMAMEGTGNLDAGQLADIVLSVLFKGIAGSGEATS
jgi:TetR/AcrR family transcriptional regulator, cholesterol catabolism regulator